MSKCPSYSVGFLSEEGVMAAGMWSKVCNFISKDFLLLKKTQQRFFSGKLSPLYSAEQLYEVIRLVYNDGSMLMYWISAH